MDPLMYNVNDPDLYGPSSVIDELVQVPYVDPGSPMPNPAAGYGDASDVSIDARDYSKTDVKTFINSGQITLNRGGGGNAGAYQNKQYRVVKFDLTNASSDVPLPFKGTFVQIVWAATWTVGSGGGLLDPDAVRGAADPAVMLSMKINDINSDPVPIAPGFQLSGVPFSRLFLSWPAQASKVVEIMLIDDQPSDRVDAAN